MTIKELRVEYDITQKQLSIITGIPKRTIEDWECNRRTPAPYMPELIIAKLDKELKK